MPELKQYTHDHMVTVLQYLYPSLRHGFDYYVVQAVDGETNEVTGDPWILWWKNKEVARPTDAEIHTAFHADEALYRSRFLRLRRDYELMDTDGKADMPSDAPPSAKAVCDRWRAYRQALRDLPQQPGFPFDVKWPEWPVIK